MKPPSGFRLAHWLWQAVIQKKHGGSSTFTNDIRSSSHGLNHGEVVDHQSFQCLVTAFVSLGTGRPKKDGRKSCPEMTKVWLKLSTCCICIKDHKRTSTNSNKQGEGTVLSWNRYVRQSWPGVNSVTPHAKCKKKIIEPTRTFKIHDDFPSLKYVWDPWRDKSKQGICKFGS